MTNPILVDVSRGPIAESYHRGAISVIDGDGRTVLDIGDTARPVYPRSAIKALQALPLVESGAADAYGFGDAELALACASHSGEDAHIALARSMLGRAGLQEDALECGGHWSSQRDVLIHQARSMPGTRPGAIYNNCSGKHAGFLCTAIHQGEGPANYIQPDHPIMQQIRDTLQALMGVSHSQAPCGKDGCSIPTYAVPLSAMAHGFARMATGIGLAPQRQQAARRLLQACMAQPFYVAGTGRFCTEFMTRGQGRLFIKTGAEGVYCGAIPELGLGIAIKCDDGNQRGSETMMAAIMATLLPTDDPLKAAIADLARRDIKNLNYDVTGHVTPSAFPLK